MPEGWVVVGGVIGAGCLIGYFAWIGLRTRLHLRQAAQQRNELRRKHHDLATEHDQLLEQFEQATAFCQRLTNTTQKGSVYQVILHQFAELGTTDSALPGVSLWLYDPAQYGFALAVSDSEATGWLATACLSLKEAPIATVAGQCKPLIIPQLPEALNRLTQQPLTGSEGVAFIPLMVEGRAHAIVLMVCSPDQLAALHRSMRTVNLVAMQASLSLGSLLHRELAIFDHLTRVYNLAYFQERLAQELQRCHRFELAVSLLLIDLDEFKPINDTYGHPAGDLVLVKTAQLITQAIRTVDLAARYGGDEFLVMLTETDRGNDPTTCEALPVAQRIRLAIAHQPFELPGQLLRVTASVGISIRELHSPAPLDSAALFKQADEQLYRAKRAGRNRCAFPDGPVVGPG